MTSGNLPLNTAILRPWTDSAGDLAAVLEAFESDDMAGQSGEPINSEEAAGRWLTYWIDKSEPNAVGFAIELDGRAVGHVMANSIEHRHDTAWISYWVSQAARGKGLAARATHALAEYCFKDLELHRLELAHRVNNPHSGSVALKAGFVVEGRERAKLRYLDETGAPARFDVQTYSRLSTDPAPALTPLPIYF